jgi:RNA polymerase sigma-70 factor, ECF subfamily
MHPRDLLPQPAASAETTARKPELTPETLHDITAAQHGDLDAATRLIEQYQWKVARWIYAILLNRADVDDVAQQVFVRMCQRLATLRDATLFEPWLYQLARRASIDFTRRERFRRLWAPFEALIGEPHPAPTRNETHDHLHELLAKLSALDRELILLAGEGHTYEEIAQRQRRSRGSVKARLARVREWLREQIETET